MHGIAGIPVRSTLHEDVRNMTLGQLEEMGRRQRVSSEPDQGILPGSRMLFLATVVVFIVALLAVGASH